MCVCLVWISSYWGAAVCEAKTNAGTEEEEVKEFVTAFCRLHTREGIKSLRDYVEDGESFSMYLIRWETAFEYGVQKCDNMDVTLWPLEDGVNWLVLVCYDLIVEDFDMGHPGAVTMLVHRREDGNLVVLWDEAPEEIVEEVREITLLDEYVDRITQQTMKYRDACVENPEILEWAYDVAAAADKAQSEAIFSENGENDSGEDGVYIVQKGDCLWSIAKEKLGDGMYWSKLYEANRSVIGDDPDLIFVGIELQIDL